MTDGIADTIRLPIGRLIFLNVLWLLGPAALLGGFGMALHPSVAITLMLASFAFANWAWIWSRP
jgi:hypothetical protein